jgi:3-hydroxybutyryl-CoA dehydrogenase
LENIHTICVCGAGTMGSGIAQVAAQAGFSTIQFDVSGEMLQKSKAAIEKSLQGLVEKQKIGEAQREAILSRIVFTSAINDCKADVVIEAIVEKPEVKLLPPCQYQNCRSGYPSHNVLPACTFSILPPS